jgi:hypothetical protein
MFDAQVADQSDFVLRGSEQMGGMLRAQHFDRVRVKSHYARRPIRRASVTGSSGNHGLVTKMYAIENSDGQEKWSAQALQFRD